MPKKKQFLQSSAKQAPQAKKKQPELETEDDFLDAADDFEKSAGKWRAGDAAKSARFFQRAIDAYAAGLQKFPKSFDLAYNKALLEYQITQDLRIAAQFGHPITELLRQALESHQFAMTLNEGNLDILFNTANVLSDLSERVVHSKEEAIPLLQESVKLTRRCLERQVQEYESLQAAFQAANSEDGPANVAPPSSTAQDTSSGSSGEEYATVEEAITERSILDTFFQFAHTVADLLGMVSPEQVEAISADVEAAVGLFSSGTLLPYLEKLDKTIPEPEAPSLSLSLSTAAAPKPAQPKQSEYTEAVAEGTLAEARLFAAVAEVEFRRGERSAASWYAVTLDKFSKTDPRADPNGYGAMADALFSIASATGATASSAAAAAADGETQYLAQAARLPVPAATDAELDALSPVPPPADPSKVTDAWTPEQIHGDALQRAYHLLTSTLGSSGAVPADKAPQLYVALGDVHWRLRSACLAILPQPDVAGALVQALKAERCWRLGAQKAQKVGLSCAEEQVEAEGKVRVSEMARGAGGGVLVGEATEKAAHAVEEMREDELLHPVLERHISKVLGRA